MILKSLAKRVNAVTTPLLTRVANQPQQAFLHQSKQNLAFYSQLATSRAFGTNNDNKGDDNAGNKNEGSKKTGLFQKKSTSSSDDHGA